MTSRDDIKHLIDLLPDAETDRAFGLLISLLRGNAAADGELDTESRAWMDADIGGDLPPFDWGSQGAPAGKPVRFVPGVGLVVDGGKDHAE